MRQLRELWSYREMIIMLVRRELRGRYKGSVLGFFWTFLNPLLQLAVYTAVFSVILRNDIERYYLFLFVALIPWIFMATSVQGGATSVLAQKSMVTKIYFPRQVLPISWVTTCFINMLLSFCIVIPVAALSNGLSLRALPYLIPTVIIEYVLALGIALLVSGITVYFRDLEHILSICVMGWQFLSPIMYPAEWVPEQYQTLFHLNPMTAVIISYRNILYYKIPPDLSTMLNALVMGLVFLIAGWALFEHLQRHFAEEL